MRDILTGLAIVVILLLTAALIGPHVVDWTAHRHLVEKRLAALTGMPVTSKGEIAIVLLPTPTVSLKDLTFGDATASTISVKTLEASLSLTSLLRGEVRVTSAALDEPVAKLVPEAGGGFAGLQRGLISPADVIVERLVIIDGKVSLSRAGRTPLEASHLYVEMEAASLLGPFRGKSRFATESGMRNFSFAAGKYDNGKVRIKALLEDELRSIRYDLDGGLALGDSKGPGFSGALAASGNLALARQEGYGQLLWHLQSPATANLDGVHLENVDLTLGAEASVKLTGTADMEFGGESAIDVTLAAKQVDLDRLLSPDPKAPVEQRPGDVIAMAATVLGAAGPSADPSQPAPKPTPVRFDLSVGTLLLGGDSLTGLSAKGLVAKGDITLDRVSGSLPGRTELDLRGTVSPMAGPRFDGQIGLDTRDARRFAAWYAGGAELALRSASGQMRISVAPGSMILSVADAKIDDGRVSALVERKVPSDAAQPPVVTATIQGRGLPLELARLLQGDTAKTDLDLKLDLSDIKVGAVSAGQAKMHVVRTRAGLSLDDVDVRNLAGLQLKGRSSLGQAGGGLLLDVDARSLDSVVDMLDRVGYPNLSRALMRRSTALNGIRATIRGDSRVDGARFANALQIEGRAGKTAISGLARWASPRTAPGSLPDADVNLHISLQSPDSAELLAQLGFETLRIDAGPGTLDIDANGPLLKGFVAKISGTLAGAKLVAEGKVAPADTFKPFDGSVSLETTDLAVPARALAVAFPPVPQGTQARMTGKASFTGTRLTFSNLDATIGGNHLQGEFALDFAQNGRIAGQLQVDSVDARVLSAVVLGQDTPLIRGGAWSRQAFGAPQPPVLAGDVWIDTPRLLLADGLPAMKTGFVYRFESGLVSFEQVQMQTPSGWLRGNLALRRTGSIVSADVHLGMNGLKLPLDGSGGLTGQLAGDLAASGSGDTAGALIGSLAGGGTLQHTGVSIAKLDPEALSRTLAVAIQPDATNDPEAVADMFDRETAKGALALPSADAVVTLAQGVLRVSPQRMPTTGGEVVLTFAADLVRQRTDAKAEFQLEKSPDRWSGRPPAATVSWSGSLLLPDRRSDTTVLSNGLAAIAIARDLERIQIYEQDARERAFFLRRQRASEQEKRRLDEERRKAEEARKAEEDARRVAEEEARRLAEQQRRLIEDDTRRAAEARKAEETARRESLRRAQEPMQRTSTPPADVSPPMVVPPPLNISPPGVTQP